MEQFARTATRLEGLEKHYTPKELGARWGVSAQTVRAIFDKVPGVLRVSRPETRGKRGYCTLRIPESVALAMHRKLSKVGG